MSCADRALPAVLGMTALLWVHGAGAVTPADIVVLPQAGQTQNQARRDRYECHNWAVGQNGSAPPAAPGAAAQAHEQRAERIEKVVTGAAVGAVAGSVVRGADDHRDAGDGAIGGAVLGAIAGAIIGERQKDREADAADAEFDAYVRALDACMSARGYALEIAESAAD